MPARKVRTRTGLCLASILFLAACDSAPVNNDGAIGADASRFNRETARACVRLVARGLRPVAESRERRFTGKVSEDAARCRGGANAVRYRDTPWVDWSNYWAAGDASSLASDVAFLDHLDRNGRGVDGALIDLEYERVELIKFNLLDNTTYEDYLRGRDGVEGPALDVWNRMRLSANHARYADVGGDAEQLCAADLIRFRNVSGICNDIRNPLMGSAGMLFARNVEFDSAFPRLGRNTLVRNRHGDRLGLLKPDPQVISRVLFTRAQRDAAACNAGLGKAGGSRCDYQPAPFFNVLAAFWIQFMTHDWFSHLEEGRNSARMMKVGCETQRVDGVATALGAVQADRLGCRPGDRMDASLVAQRDEPASIEIDGRRHPVRAARTFRNNVTAWWDASQIYGHDEVSRRRVKRDPRDRARLLLVDRDGLADGASATGGYLPLFESCAAAPSGSICRPDPINPAWAGQEATAFADNFTIGMSFYHNVFAREHNAFVAAFRARTARTPDADSGLRDPARPEHIIRYRDVTDDELFEVARLVVAMEIAKIHTIEWTTQLLYDEPLFRAMNSNWGGLFGEHERVEKALGIVVKKLGESNEAKKANQWYSVFAAGPGVIGLGSRRYEGRTVFGKLLRNNDIWSIANPDHVNGGINHFGSPFNFPEEFVSVYRLHTMVPDLIEYRELGDRNAITDRVPVVTTFRGRASDAMRSRGLANWALSMGRQRLGALTLKNHPQFLQNLTLQRLDSATGKVDVAALDIIRDRERGVPRFNEFRRQYGLRQLTSFDDFVDRRLPEDSAERREQLARVRLLREVYGQHRCDASKVITRAQLNVDGSPITDCLGQPDGSMVDNVEDIDTVVGWLAETTRPHGFAISETQFVVFILNASRRLFSDRFFTSSFRPEFYSTLGYEWIMNNGPDGPVMEAGRPNGHAMPVSPLKRVLLRTVPELAAELGPVVNAFDPWARDRGDYYSLAWRPRPGAESDEAFRPGHD